MDQPRGRSPSTGRQNISRGPSPHPYPQSVPGVDPSVQEALTTGKFNTTSHNAQSFQNPFPQYQDPQYNQQTYQANQYTQQLDPSFNDQFMFQQQMDNQWQQNYSMDPSYNMNQQSNINPQDLNRTPEDHQSPSLLSPENHSSPGPQSPASTNGQFYTPQHSRHTSLDPSSAYGEFQGASFQGHRRAPSDHSDVSSTQHSPYLGHVEPQIDTSHSPFMAAQQDVSNSFGMDNFSIAEQHVPYRSPRLMPTMENQQQFTGQEMGLGMTMPAPPEIYTTQPEYSQGHLRNQSIVSDIGQADQYAPPTINIEPAPVSRQGSFGPQGQMEGALSPPASKGKSAIPCIYHANN